jgi:glucose uptake protein GlcU
MTLGVLVILILVGVALYNLKKKSDKEVEQVEAVVVPQPVVETVVETVKKPRKPRKK